MRISIIGATCIIVSCLAAVSGCSVVERVDRTIARLGTANEQLVIANGQLGTGRTSAWRRCSLNLMRLTTRLRRLTRNWIRRIQPSPR